MANRNQKFGVSVVWSSPFDLCPLGIPPWLGVYVHTLTHIQPNPQIRVVRNSERKNERTKMAPNQPTDNQPTETTH